MPSWLRMIVSAQAGSRNIAVRRKPCGSSFSPLLAVVVSDARTTRDVGANSRVALPEAPFLDPPLSMATERHPASKPICGVDAPDADFCLSRGFLGIGESKPLSAFNAIASCNTSKEEGLSVSAGGVINILDALVELYEFINVCCVLYNPGDCGGDEGLQPNVVQTDPASNVSAPLPREPAYDWEGESGPSQLRGDMDRGSSAVREKSRGGSSDQLRVQGDPTCEWEWAFERGADGPDESDLDLSNNAVRRLPGHLGL